jgi:hypothetical protein
MVVTSLLCSLGFIARDHLRGCMLAWTQHGVAPACLVCVLRDEDSQWSQVREQGLDVLRQQQRINGQVTFNSPFAAMDRLDTLAARKREAAARAAAHQHQQQ